MTIVTLKKSDIESLQNYRFSVPLIQKPWSLETRMLVCLYVYYLWICAPLSPEKLG
jgi:hypothetical protein